MSFFPARRTYTFCFLGIKCCCYCCCWLQSILSSKKKFWLSFNSWFSPWVLFRGFCGIFVACSKDCSSSLFIISTCYCTIILIQIAKFFCTIKSLFTIHLTFQINNLKLNSVVYFAAIYALANKFIKALFIISNIKITGLKIWFVCFSTKSAWSILLMS